MHIIYVNGKYRGDDPVGWLMHDFNCINAREMKNEFLAEKFRYLKENDKGVKYMCKIMEEFAKEEREEARAETQIETAVKLVITGKMTENEVQEFFNFTDNQMQEVKDKIANLN